MARTGRPKFSDPPVPWKIHVSTSQAAKLELLLADPFTGSPRVGARAALFRELLNALLIAWERGEPREDDLQPALNLLYKYAKGEL